MLYQVIGIIALLLVITTIVILQVWWRRHRSHETRLQKRQEDQVIKAEGKIW